MDYAELLAMAWDDGDAEPLTQEAIFGSQPPSAQVHNVQDMGHTAAAGDTTAAGGRGSSYKPEEDLLLVKAWLNVSMDPVVGSNQSLGAFWQRAESFYHENKDFTFISTRNRKSLQGRWTVINALVQKFCDHYGRAVRNKRSGTTEAETVVEALRLYQAAEHKDFTLMTCWRELRNHPKWEAETSRKRQKTTAAGSPSSTPHVGSCAGMDGGEDVDAAPSMGTQSGKCPPGRTRSKEARGTTSSTSASGPMTELFNQQLAMKDKVEKERADRFATLMDVERHKIRLEEDRMKMEHEKDRMRVRLEEERMKIEHERLRHEAELKQMEKEKEEQRMRFEAERMKIKQEEKHERRRLEAERMQMEKEKEEWQIMSMDLSHMDEEQKDYYKSLRQSIIAARRATSGP